MPQLIGVAVLSAIGADVGLTIFGTVSVATLIGQVILTVIFVGLSLLLKPSLPKPSDGHQATKQEIPPKIMGYGRVRIGGNYTLYESAGSNTVDVDALVDGYVRGFVKIFLHDDEVILSNTEPASAAYEVIAGADATDGRYVNHVHIDRRYGLPTETAYPGVVALLPSLWTSAHRGDGTASIAIIGEGASADGFQKAYPHGLPVPSAVLDMPAVWDARDPAQDPDDPDTWVDYAAYNAGTTYAAGDRVLYTPDTLGGGAVYYSRVGSNTGNTPDTSLSKWCRVDTNPVLILIDVLTSQKHGMGLPRSVLIDPVIDALMVEADLCDELVQLKSLDYEPRYACNGWFTYDTEPEKLIASILATMDGFMTENGEGGLALTVGSYRAPDSLEMGPNHIVAFQPKYGLPDESAINEMAFRYTSPSHKYKEAPGQSLRDEEDIAARGRKRSQSLDLIWVQSHPQGRRLQKRAMARAKAPVRGSCVSTLYGLNFLGKRWFRMSYPDITGFESVIVEVTKCERNILAGRLSWEWIVINPNEIDAWDAATEEGSPPVVADNNADDILPVPQNVELELVGTDATGHTVKVSFDDPQRSDLTYRMRFRVADDPLNPGPWSPDQSLNAPTLDVDRLFTETTVLPTDHTFIFEVASVGSRGTLGEWSDAFVFASSDALAREDEGYILREDGSFILREAA